MKSYLVTLYESYNRPSQIPTHLASLFPRVSPFPYRLTGGQWFYKSSLLISPLQQHIMYISPGNNHRSQFFMYNLFIFDCTGFSLLGMDVL